MKSVKQILGVLVIMVCTLFLVPNNVLASATKDEVDTLIKEIAPNGKIVIKAKEPKSFEEADALLTGYFGNLLKLDGCDVYAWSNSSDSYDNITIQINSDDYNTNEEVVVSGWLENYTLNATYDAPKSNSVVEGYLNKLKSSDTYYVEDLSLINYYLTGDKSELWNSGAPGRALKFSTLNNVTSGSNISYYIDIRLGEQDEGLMYESAFGPMNIFYNGYSYGAKEEWIYLKRVIYIPEDTKDSKEAFVAAAQKRIDDYLGSGSVVVSYGGLLSSLPEGAEDEGNKPENDGNYYNIKIGNRTYKFYIVKASSDKLVEPTYLGTNIESNIQITSVDSSIPLDTSLTVKNVNDSSIKDIIGTENYKSYDISLYSDAKGVKIEKLENGKFLVKIPVPTELNGKDLIVYYIASDGTKEEHEVTIKNGYATFETNHFSIYILAENNTNNTSNISNTKNTITDKTIENPQTSDNILLYAVMGIISSISLSGVTIYFKKNNA